MVRRGRSGAVSKSTAGQTRLDDVLSVDPEARVEKDYQEMRENRSPKPSVPYDQRVAAWIHEREETIKRRAAIDAAKEKKVP